MDHSKATVVLHAEIAVFRVGVLPGDHEHREALAGEISHQGILRRQVENVVLHDPSRYDQHRLGMDLLGCRLVLDELDQPIAKDDLARSRGDTAADLVGLAADRLLAADRPFPILEQVLPAEKEVLAAALQGPLQKLGICRQEVRG